MKENVRSLENSQLLCYLLISRDNLGSIKRALNDDRNNTELQELFDIERKNYEKLLVELYRRMNEGRKGKWVKV